MSIFLENLQKESAENLEQQDTPEINHLHTSVNKFNIISIDDYDTPSLLKIHNVSQK